MPRKLRSGALTPAELELMRILWDHGPANVQSILDRLPKERELAYTTVQTVLAVLHKKGKVRRTYENRAYIYEAAVSRGGVENNAIRELINGLFDGSAEKLVLAMVETQQLTPEKLERLQRMVEAARDSEIKE